MRRAAGVQDATEPKRKVGRPRRKGPALKSTKLPMSFFDRAERLLITMFDAPEVAAIMSPSSAAVLRIAISIGLGDLERRYLPKKEEKERSIDAQG